MMQADYITVTEAAKLLGVTRKTVYRFLEGGQLRRFERMGRTVLDREEVLRYGEVKPAEPSSPPDASHNDA